MKNLFISSALLLSACISTASYETIMKATDEEVAQIEELKSTYETEERDSVLTSSEGGTDLAYYDMTLAFPHEYMRDLKKIESTLYGESGKTFISFYYKEDELIFISEEDIWYNSSITEENFEDAEWSTSEESFYFNDGSMIGWLDAEGNSIDSESPEFKEEEQEWLETDQILRGL
jgi:hypothetical protein